MRLNILCFALGVWLLQQQAQLPDLRYAWLLTVIVPVLALGFARHQALRAIGRAGVALLAVVAGFTWAASAAHVRLSDALPSEWEGRDIELIGVVAALPQADERSVRFEFDVEHLITPDAKVPARIVLSWWGGLLSPPEVHAGERWRFVVRLKRPHGAVNPHGFDYEAWLLERGIRATGYVRPRSAPERLDTMVHRPMYWVEATRERLRTRILDALAGRPYAGIIAALAIGDQRAIPGEQWQTFTRTGVNHLMSISGLHVTMVSGLGFAFVLGLWRRSRRLAVILPATKAAAAAGLITAFAYTLLAGFAVPAQRTLYMIAVVAVALWTGRLTSASVVLSAALLVVLLLDPWAVISAGFWLSFGAVAAIFFVTVNRVARPGWFSSWAQTQAAVTVALLPLLLALFQQVSLISPVANAFAIPVVSLVVAPLALIGMILPFDAVLHLAHFAMTCCMYALEWLSALPHAVWEQHAPPAWAVAVAMAGIVWLMMPRGIPGRWLGGVACLPLFFATTAPPRPGELRLTILDVGQGLAIVARTAEHALLYDTGPAFGTGADSGNRVIAPYLRAVGVRSLDGMIVSHDDMDHTGGALSVLQALPVGWLGTSLAEMDPLPLFAERAFRCEAGQAWAWDGVRFEMLHPDPPSYDKRMKDNDRSCVLKITAQSGSVLIPGDIERRAEETLLRAGALLAADVLIAPHQGSNTSSTPAFVQNVSARSVVFPVGYRNRFGHPHAAVVERYQALGTRLYRTDRDGAVLITFDLQKIQLQRYRALYRRYWLEAPEDEASPLDGELERVW